jgi:branched-chain amino acid transport system permease protein
MKKFFRIRTLLELSRKKGLWGWGILFLLIILLPHFAKGAYYLDFLFKILFYATVAGAWNISCGYAGALSLGHAVFFGIGAYTSTLLFLHFGMSPWAGMVVGGILASVFAIIIGYLSFRLHGPFFVLSTIAAAEVFRLTSIHWRALTDGSLGLSIPFQPSWATFVFRSRLEYVYIIFGFMLLVILISYLIERSRVGYYIMAMRDDEDAAESIGINTLQMKVMATSISAFLTAIGGTIYAQYILFIEPNSVFGIDFSIQVALIYIIGGMGTISGPVLGSFLITPLGQYLRGWFGGTYMGLHFIIYGFLLIVIVLFIPEGIIPAFSVKGRLRDIRKQLFNRLI